MTGTSSSVSPEFVSLVIEGADTLLARIIATCCSIAREVFEALDEAEPPTKARASTLAMEVCQDVADAMLLPLVPNDRVRSELARYFAAAQVDEAKAVFAEEEL
jgi:hypothetical protein